jgi:serpin B
MFRRLIVTLFLLLQFFNLAWSFDEGEVLKEMSSNEPVNIKEDPYFQQLINGANQFAFDLYQELKGKRGNLFFSSYNLAIGLNMVGLGAAGETSGEIKNALRYSLNLYPLFYDLNYYLGANHGDSKNFFLSITDAVWLQKGLSFLPSYQITLKRSFEEGLQFVDYEYPSQALNTINNWISKSTQGRIGQIVSALDINKDTRFVLTTAFFWKGEWSTPFDRYTTAKEPFDYKGHSFQVEMMKQISEYLVFSDEQFEIIEIPFKQAAQNKASLSMIIFLPKKEMELSVLESHLNAQQWNLWVKKLKVQSVEIHLPKFRVDSFLDYKDLLQNLGVKQAFVPSANFSGITQKEKIFLNKVAHKSFLRIDESGSNASLAVSIKKQTKLENPVVMQINRPFFFVIQDKETNLILSLGRVVQP